MFEFITSLFKPTPVSAETKNEIEKLIESNKVMVFSKTYCPYCTLTKDLLSSKTKELKVLELNTLANGKEIQEGLREMTGQSTVPNIFINGKHIGGNSDLQSLDRSGKLVL
ncbi:uncharacterized protein PRCAT00003333001 [Priceomyces carsonii]|uniref:uncharacterized protein n=1 Tax=Priceomyces carsonii TaxID=28549 RepID=UPI002ED88F0D|nr:unnamed protein product [Priceomyces carsonii]